MIPFLLVYFLKRKQKFLDISLPYPYFHGSLVFNLFQRVVVVEDIERLNAILGNEDDYDAILKALNDLKFLKPSKEILLKTKIGHRISKLRRSQNPIIRRLACEIFADWKKFYKTQRQRETIEVRCDSKTELSRMKARKLLADTLHLKVWVFGIVLPSTC